MTELEFERKFDWLQREKEGGKEERGKQYVISDECKYPMWERAIKLHPSKDKQHSLQMKIAGLGESFLEAQLVVPFLGKCKANVPLPESRVQTHLQESSRKEKEGSL